MVNLGSPGLASWQKSFDVFHRLTDVEKVYRSVASSKELPLCVEITVTTPSFFTAVLEKGNCLCELIDARRNRHKGSRQTGSDWSLILWQRRPFQQGASGARN
jgi:hypothetical protein